MKSMVEDVSIICVTDMCPKMLKEHLKLNAVSLDTLDKVKNCMEKWVQANVTEYGPSAMDIDAVTKKKFDDLQKEVNALRKGAPAGKGGGLQLVELIEAAEDDRKRRQAVPLPQRR